jgi:hypothetical protein
MSYQLSMLLCGLAVSTCWGVSKGHICLLWCDFDWGPMTLREWCQVSGSGIMDCPGLYACVSAAHNTVLKMSIIYGI